jgi:hypothetical protein
MPAAPVFYIDLHKKTNDLVMATHGRGIIIIDDISVLRQITQNIVNKDVHFFETKAYPKLEESSFGGTASELEFVGENPNSNAQIVYYLKKRNTFGKMEMEIQDANGKKVVKLPVSNQKGINIVTWSFNEKGPKSAQGKTIDYSGFTTPLAPAGKYKAVLTKGKEVYTHEFEITNDPKSVITASAREEQYKTAHMLFDKIQELAYMVYQVDEMLKVADELSIKVPSMKKMNSKISSELNSLKNTMVVTTGDNYVGSAEKQLREKLGAIYSSVAGQFDAPSPSQKANIESVMELFNTAKTKFESLKVTNYKKLNEAAIKNSIPFKLKSMDEFLAE